MVMDIKKHLSSTEFAHPFAGASVISSDNIPAASDVDKTVFFMKRAYSDQEDSNVDYVVTCISQADIDRIELVYKLLGEHKIEDASIGFSRVYWGCGDVESECRLRNAQMEISQNGWMFVKDHPKDSGSIYADAMPLAGVVAVFNQASDGDLIAVHHRDQSSFEDFMVKMGMEWEAHPSDVCIQRVLAGLMEVIEDPEDVLLENGLDRVCEFLMAHAAQRDLLALEAP